MAHIDAYVIIEEVNINSLAKAGSVGSEGPPGEDGEDGEDGADGADGESALNILQKLEAPPASSAEELNLYKGIFAEGSNDTAEGDSAIQILKGLVDHITAKVTRNIGSGVPPHTVIIFHLNMNEYETDTARFRETGDNFPMELAGILHYYLDSGTTDAHANTVGEAIVGGINDEKEKLPAGFQVCNGAKLKKIKSDGTLENDEGFNSPDFRGRFPMGVGRAIAVSNRGGGSAGYVDGEFYYQGFPAGEKAVALGMAHMPRHRHNYHIRGGHWETGSIIYQVTGSEAKSDVLDMKTDLQGGDAGGAAGAKAEGDSYPHNNLPPFKPVVYLIKVKDER